MAVLNRRDFLKSLGAGAAGAAVPGGSPAPPKRDPSVPVVKRPNVLFIAVDDLRPELGCYGNTNIRTPTIDRIAREGVVFSRAYCQQSLCNPSRTSLLTGLRPDSAKVWDLNVHFRDTVPDIVTLPQHFRLNGYRTLAFGKVFHTPNPDRRSWSEPNVWPRTSSLYSKETETRLEERIARAREEGRSEVFIRDHIRGPATEAEDVPDNRRWDGEIAEQAANALFALSKRSEPFFLAVGFVLPHLPFVPPKKYWDLYDPAKIPVPPNPLLPDGVPQMAMNSLAELRDYSDFADTPRPGEGTLSEEQRRRLRHGYYASVSFIDAQVARLMLFLENLGLAKETIIVLWGDNGFKLGDLGSWGKKTNYEVDTRCPLIIRAPGVGLKSEVCPRPVELLDVFPTLCELAGLPLPSHLQGLSLTPLLKAPNRVWRNAAFSQYYRRFRAFHAMGYALRTEFHRFVEWRSFETGEILAEELYDHRADPHESRNIAGMPESLETVERLRARLRQSCPIQRRLGPAIIHSQSSDVRARVDIVNEMDETATIYEINADGARRWLHALKPGEAMTVDTFLTHPFVAIDTSGEYYQVFYADYLRRRVVLRRPGR